MTETELAKNVISWLTADDWDIYQEVSSDGGRADIVAVKQGLSWVIETKVNYGIAVLEQAFNWLGYANFVSVAVSRGVKRRRGNVAHYIHIDKGIGLITVNQFGWVSISEDAKLFRLKNRKSIKDILCPEQKTMSNAGSANGGYFTPFKRTVGDIQRYIANNPGTTLKELIAETGYYHYVNKASAKGSIAKYILNGIIPNIKVVVEKGKHKLFYEKPKEKK